MTRSLWTLLIDREDTFAVGQDLGRLFCVHPDWPRVIAAIGNLGAGKTSLAQGIARGLGVPANVYVNSPTFALHQTHQGQVAFHHLDLYRLMDEDELTYLGFEEILEHGVSYIEWPQRAPRLFATIPHFKVDLFYIDEWSHDYQTEGGDHLPEEGRILQLRGPEDALDYIGNDPRWSQRLECARER